MAADNVKTAFRLPSGVNEDFISQHHQQQQHQKKISTTNNTISISSHQKVFRNINRKRPVLKPLFNKVAGLQPAALSEKRLQHRCFPVKLMRTRFFVEHLLLEEHMILQKTVPIAIIPQGWYTYDVHSEGVGGLKGGSKVKMRCYQT